MSTDNYLIKQNTNCIRQKKDFNHLREYKQYDDQGNIIYYYKEVPDLFNNEKFIVYDIDQKVIGSVKKVSNCCDIQYILSDEINKITKKIVLNYDCRSNIYSFHGLDENIESTITKKLGCCEYIFDEYDKYNTRAHSAQLKFYMQNEDCFEKDSNGKLNFIIRKYHDKGEIMKIFDANNIEVNLSNKTLFNNGFTKIQILLLLDILFYKYDE